MCGQDQGGTRTFACDSQNASAHVKPGLCPLTHIHVKSKLATLQEGTGIIADIHPIEGTPTSQWDPDQACWVCMRGRQGSLHSEKPHSTQKIKILRFGNSKKKTTNHPPLRKPQHSHLGIPQMMCCYGNQRLNYSAVECGRS